MSADPFASAIGNDVFEVDMGKEGGRPPAGTAILQLADVRKQVSQNGNPMWVFEFAIVEYQLVDGNGDVGEWLGEILPVYCALTPNAMWKMSETMGALGIQRDENEPLAKFKLSDVVNTQCLASLKHAEFNGQLRTEIDALRAHPDGAGTKGGELGGAPVVPAAPTAAAPDTDVF